MITKQSLRSMPKVELHRHLDGSVRFETILDLAKKNEIKLPRPKNQPLDEFIKITKPMQSLDEVLDSFGTMQKVLCNYEAIKRVSFENVEDCFRDGIKLAELRFAPTYIAKGNNIGNDEIIEAVLDGVSQGLEKYNIQVGLIGILPRGLEFELNQQATDDLIRYKNSIHRNSDRLVGFDLADRERCRPFSDFAPLVDNARDNGFGITIHSGEDTDAESVLETLEVFRPQRIGHGIKIWGHDKAMSAVREANILLEVCPISNWLTNCVPTLEEHPLPLLYNHGVSVCLNSDDPNIMNIDLIDEYINAQEKYKFKSDQFLKMNQDALLFSFLDTDRKSKVKLS